MVEWSSKRVPLRKPAFELGTPGFPCTCVWASAASPSHTCHMSSTCSMAVGQMRRRGLIHFKSEGMNSLKAASRRAVQSSEASSLLECASGRTVVALALTCPCDTCFHRGQSWWRGLAGVFSRALWAKRNMVLNLGSQEASRAKAGNRAQNGLE